MKLLILLNLLGLLACGSGGGGGKSHDPAPDDPYARVSAALETNCGSCHRPGSAYTAFVGDRERAEAAKERICVRVKAGEMPPSGNMPATDRATIIEFCETSPPPQPAPEETSPEEPTDEAYKAVALIISAKCGGSSCHGAGAVNTHFVGNQTLVDQNKAAIYELVASGQMPVTGYLTSTEKAAILKYCEAAVPPPPPRVPSPPSVTIVTSSASPTSSASIAFSLSFSAPVIDFSTSLLALSGGSVVSGSLQGSGASYSLAVSPLGDGAVTINLPAGRVYNSYGDGNLLSNTVTIVYDGTPPSAPLLTDLSTPTWDVTPPTATIATSSASPTSTSPVAFSLSFSEAVTGVSVSDFTVTGGTVTAGSLSWSGSNYELSVTPTSTSSASTITVTFPAAAAADLAGNLNQASNSVSVSYAPPAVLYSQVSPIITEKCGGSGCHGPTAPRLILVNNQANVDANKAIIYFAVYSYYMPKTVSLSAAERDLILDYFVNSDE